jgi:hypothetical protein
MLEQHKIDGGCLNVRLVVFCNPSQTHARNQKCRLLPNFLPISTGDMRPLQRKLRVP